MTVELRKALYGLLAAVGTFLVATNQMTDTSVASWLIVADAAFVVAALVMAAIKTKRVDYTAFYGGGAALLAGLAGVNLISPNTLGLAGQILLFASIVAPMLIAYLRTDTSTASGSPASEVTS